MNVDALKVSQQKAEPSGKKEDKKEKKSSKQMAIQIDEARLIRPRAAYGGELDRKWVPIEERG